MATTREADRPLQLLDIARRLFAQKGYAGTSLRDIASEAGITKAALYHHFPNKEALYDKVVLDGLRALFAYVEQAVAAADGATPKIRAFMRASAENFQSERNQWIASSTTFWSGGSAGHRPAAVQIRDGYEGLLRRCIAEGIASGELRADLDPGLTGKLLLSVLNQLQRWHKAEGRLTAPQIIDQFVDMILQGIAEPQAPAGKAASPRGLGRPGASQRTH